MKTVYKYPLTLESRLVISLPEDHQIVHVEAQCDEPMVWVLLDSDAPKRPFQYALVGTGHPVPDEYVHVRSFQQFDGMLVWHLFAEERG